MPKYNFTTDLMVRAGAIPPVGAKNALSDDLVRASTGDTRRWWNQGGNWLDQTDDRLAGWNVLFPETSISTWENVAANPYGMYGDESTISNILRGDSTVRQLQAKAIIDKLFRGYAGRLGSRAGGAANVMAMNNAIGPGYLQALSQRAGLRKEGAASRMTALENRDKVFEILTQALTSRLNAKTAGDASKPGLVDYITALGGILGG